MVKEEKLDFWITNGYNVLFSGKHGVGKTSIIKDAFDRANLNWLYFSASTMDPWVDFIGVPKEKELDDGTSYLELIRPLEFAQDNVEALFFDEYNRSPKKVRNAVMELIQFRSINGKQFKKLKIIWAAVNPSDDEDESYDVEEIDPAQLDRFQIKVDIPYKPHLPYFRQKYGSNNARAAISWWNSLNSDAKKLVSPRRLDYALDVHQKNGDLRDVLPERTNISKLLTTLKNGPLKEKLEKLFKEKDKEEAKAFIRNENNYAAAIDSILRKNDYVEFFVPLLNSEKISYLLSQNKKTFDKIIAHAMCPAVAKEIKEIYSAKQNRKFSRWVDKEIEKGHYELECAIEGKPEGSVKERRLHAAIKRAKKEVSKRFGNTQHRKKAIRIIRNAMHDDIPLQYAQQILSILGKIADRSHTSTLEKFMGFSNIINKCLKATQKHKSFNAKEAFKYCKTHHSKLFKKVETSSRLMSDITGT